jgi:hypothetical protein
MRRRWTEVEARAFAHRWATEYCTGPLDEEALVKQLLAAPPATERQLRASSALLFGTTPGDRDGGDRRGEST